jgi:hypothetical protein
MSIPRVFCGCCSGKRINSRFLRSRLLLRLTNQSTWSFVSSGLRCTSCDRQGDTRELVIPLMSDREFLEQLSGALQTFSAHLLSLRTDFVSTLEGLSRAISLSARPTSSTSSFHPHSYLSDPAAISIRMSSGSKSDLYTWREIFQLYMEAEVFQSISEANRGSRTVEDAEERLSLFAKQVTKRGFHHEKVFKLKHSRAALETFLQLNMFILNVKKVRDRCTTTILLSILQVLQFVHANREATRKILKKRTKRTALPLPCGESFPSGTLTIPDESASLPRILVQAICETLLPVIPHVDDYSCLICTSIAFKPIRLFCGHLFCVRSEVM